MLDERENLPSISAFESLSLCPIRHRLGLSVPELAESQDAQYGNDVHRARETGDIEDLTDDQRDLVDEMDKQETALLKEIFGKEMPAEQYREKRFWYTQKPIQFASVPKKLFSGKLDFSAWAHSKERVSVYIDYKALWGDVTPPARNLQLRGGAVLMKQNFGSRRAFVAILQPTKRKIAIAAEYGPEELEAAELECVHIVDRAMAPDSQPNPGPEQCRYCRAKLICDAAHQESVHELAKFEEHLDASTEMVKLLLAKNTDSYLDKLGHAWEVAQIIGKAIDAEIRRRKERDPAAMPNYHFVPSGHTSELGNPAFVWPRFRKLLSAETFASICRVPKGELEKAVQSATGYKKKDAQETVEKLLGELLVKKPKKPSLERKPYYEIKS